MHKYCCQLCGQAACKKYTVNISIRASCPLPNWLQSVCFFGSRCTMPSLASLASLPMVNANPLTSASTLGGAVSLTLANGNPTPIAASGLVNLSPLAGSGSSPQTTGGGGSMWESCWPPSPTGWLTKYTEWNLWTWQKCFQSFGPSNETRMRIRGAPPQGESQSR